MTTKKKQITVTLDVDVYEWLEKIAKENRVSRSTIVNMALASRMEDGSKVKGV